MQAITDALDEISLAFNTCLFINDFLASSKVASDIIAAVEKLSASRSLSEYHKEYWKAVNLILAAAKKSAL